MEDELNCPNRLLSAHRGRIAVNAAGECLDCGRKLQARARLHGSRYGINARRANSAQISYNGAPE